MNPPQTIRNVVNALLCRETQEERLDCAMLKESKRTKIDGDGYHYGRSQLYLTALAAFVSRGCC